MSRRVRCIFCTGLPILFQETALPVFIYLRYSLSELFLKA